MNKKIKVLHVIGKRPQGGIGTFLYNITEKIDHSKFEFEFLINGSSEPGEFDKKMKMLGANVHVLPELKYKNTFLYLKSLEEFYLKHHDYDVIHIHSAILTLFNYWANKKYGNAIIAVHSHSTKYSDKFLNSIRNYFLHYPVKRIADAFFACSNSAANFLFGKTDKVKKEVYIIQNSIEVEKYKFDPEVRSEVRRKLDIKNRLVVGHVGAFLPVKNHEFIIDIFFELKKIEKNALLILVGTGELEDKIKNKVKKLDLANSVLYLGRRTDVHDLMQAFDVFILPSQFEGVPLVGVEAQASGLPCIFSSAITCDIKVLSCAKFIDLSAGSMYWAKEIQKSSKYYRNDTSEELISAGYDIQNSVAKLQESYSSVVSHLS